MTRLVFLFPILLSLSACSLTQPPAGVTYYGSGEGVGSRGGHIVLKGDTLYSLSKRYNVALQDIAVENAMRAPFRLEVGARVNIPAPQTYRVRAGDTLYSISRLFEASRAELASLNDLRAPYRINEGQLINVSGLHAPVAKSAEAAYAKNAEVEEKSGGFFKRFAMLYKKL